MASRKLFGAAVVVTAIVFAVLGTAGVAVAADNSACMACHSGTMNWTVGAVNKATACPKCHVASLANTHPYHNPGSNCGSCHPGWGLSTPAMTPGYSGGSGAFVSAASENATSGELHVIHAQVAWTSNVSATSQACASCHTVAACTACHNGTAPASIHATHSASGVCQPSGNTSYPARSPWSGRFGYGVSGGNLLEQTDAAVNNQCSIPECHDTTGLAAKDPVATDDGAGSLSGIWRVKYGATYSSDRMVYSNSVGAQASYTFSGNGVAIVTDTDPYRGFADIIIDGVTTTTVDLYSATTKYQVEVWRTTALPAGSHTVSIRVNGGRNALARSNFVTLDTFSVWPTFTTSVTPACTACHPDRTAAHGRTWSHESSKAAGFYATYTCNACHQVNATSTPAGTLDVEHNRTTSSSYGQGCTTCHTTYAPQSWTATTTQGGCAYGTCHKAGTAREAHTASQTLHAVSTAPADALCKTCHTGVRDELIHDSIATTTSPSTNCLTCHGTQKYPASNSCTDAGCHTRSGTAITTMNSHVWNWRIEAAHVASSTDTSVVASHSGGKACSTCHLGFTAATTIVNEHAKPSSLTSVGTDIDCVMCHSTSYLPAVWTDKCTECHATGKAGIPSSSTATAYTTDHNFATWSATNNTSCGTLNGSSCHDVTMADAIHNSANPGAGDCTSCHTSASALPTAHLCSDCHAGSPYHSASIPASAHDASAQSECLSCHANKSNISTGHASCATCHSNATLTDYLKNNYTAACSDCHATGAGKLGSHAYTPANPNHYSASPTHTAGSMNTTIDVAYSYDVQCQSCHSAELKPAHTNTTARLDSAHTSWGPNSATAFCVSCHSSTYAEANAVTVVASGWTPNTCDECHVTHGNGKHTTYSTAHTATVGTPGVADNCGTAAACHGTDRNVRRIHNRATSGCNAVGSDTKGWSGSCHALDKDMFGTPMSCGSGSGGCHTSHTNSNHGSAPHTLDTTTSAYNNTSVTGCTGAGAGCHGSTVATAYASTQYHPVAGVQCTSSKCHDAGATNHNDPAFDDPNSCQDCHGGGAVDYVQAPLVSNLTTTTGAAKGHYNETTHSAGTASTTTSLTAGGSASARCDQCHNPADALNLDKLHNQHQGFETSQVSAAAYADVTCSECHNYNVKTISLVGSATAWADTCSACHNATDMPAYSQHTTASAPSVIGTSPVGGCGATGAGCHTSYDLHALHRNAAGGCALSNCHNFTLQGRNPGIKGCGTGQGCHTNYAVSASTATGHVRGTSGITGNDTTHTATGMTGDASGGTYTAKGNTCADCHSAGLNSAHTTVTANLNSGNTSWGAGPNFCIKCHTSNSPVKATNVVTTGADPWSTKTCDECHVTNGPGKHASYTTSHTASLLGGCTASNAGCHNTADVRAIHNRTTSGCTAIGADSKGWSGSCHSLNEQMRAGTGALLTPMSCGSTGGCHTAHTNSNHGGSSGGSDCLTGCHGSDGFSSMISTTTSYHHVLDAATPGLAPNTGAYPTSTSSLACVSCHTDHNYFNTTKGANLRTNVASTAGSAATNTDFIATSGYGICISCHSVALTKSTAQKTTSASAQVTTITGADYAAGAHNYSVTTSFGATAADVFEANCSKCHDDANDSISKMRSKAKIGTHFSADSRLLAAMGVTTVTASVMSEEKLCYACHIHAANSATDTKTVDGFDGYGEKAMSSVAETIWADVQKTYGHQVDSATMAGRHRTIEGTTSGWNPAATRHVECEDCHDTHASKPGTTPPAYITARAAGVVPPIAGANFGSWGVTFNSGMTSGNWSGLGTFGNPTTPTAANYVRVESASYQWQMCLKCHSTYAWTTTPPSVSVNLQGQANGKQTDVGGDFNPMNYAVHPIFAEGKNQPPTNANGTWVNSGGARMNATTIGLANTMTDGWLTTSRVVCTDCHNNDDPTSSSGPHGSNNRWIIAGVDRNTKVTLWDGTVSYVNNNALIPSTNFCLNCHRADVYGFGRTGAGTTDGTYGTLSRVNHSGFNASCGDPAVLGTVLQYTGCLGCHGGRKDQRSYGNPTTSTVPVQSGGIHGTRMNTGDPGGTAVDAMGYRFMNGASWHSHRLGDASGNGGCFTAAKTSPASDNYSSCTQHGGERSFTPQYYYARPTN